MAEEPARRKQRNKDNNFTRRRCKNRTWLQGPDCRAARSEENAMSLHGPNCWHRLLHPDHGFQPRTQFHRRAKKSARPVLQTGRSWLMTVVAVGKYGGRFARTRGHGSGRLFSENENARRGENAGGGTRGSG